MIETINIEQEVMFEGATPHEIFELLMDQKKFSKWSGKKAEVSRKVGGEVMAYGGFVKAVNVELVADKRIVQAWKGGIAQWPKDHYSVTVFDLKKVAKGTRLSFSHYGVPKNGKETIIGGWPDAFWDPMKKYLSA